MKWPKQTIGARMQQLFDGLKAHVTRIRANSEVIESDNAFICCSNTKKHFRVEIRNGAMIEIQCFHACHPYTSRVSNVTVNNGIFEITGFEFIDHAHDDTRLIIDQMLFQTTTPWGCTASRETSCLSKGFATARWRTRPPWIRESV